MNIRPSKEDLWLIERAKYLARERKVSGCTVEGVGSALLMKEGKTFTGVSIDLECGIGFCAEYSAIASITS